MKKKAWIGLGGNIGNREEYLDKALEMMKTDGILPVFISSYIETKPYGNVNQNDFINAVTMVETDKSPHDLLKTLLEIERSLGRVREVKWGPRTIDLDILFYEDEIICSDSLTIPHPEIQKRRFVLDSLLEISPDKIHPVFNKTVSELSKDLELLEEMDWLEKRERFGIKLGLDNTYALLERFGNPHKKLSCLHIAGTNGKGSLCTYLSYVLEEAGYKVGLFTSPFIGSFEERFQINHNNILKEDLLTLLKDMHIIIDEMEKEDICPTYFEVLTVLCFEYFSRQKVDFAVIEVGLGGLYDSTNVIEHPLAVFISTINYDHMEFLGDTLEKIAEQKAGIIKDGSFVFCYPNKDEVIEIFKRQAKLHHSKIAVLDKQDIRIEKVEVGNTVFSYRDKKDIVLSMWGEHQAFNASLAILGLETLKKEGSVNFSSKQLYLGLKKARLTARLEMLSREPFFLLDGAHNPEGIFALKKALENIKYKRLILGLCILKDKQYKDMISLLVPLADEIITTEIPMQRSLKAEELYMEVSQINSHVYCEGNIEKAVEKSIEIANKEDLILWCGSLYLAGEVRKTVLNCS